MDLFRVQYECQCGSWSSLNYMFYCTSCQKLRCDHCIYEEIDVIYCSNCLDTTSIADTKRGICAKCYECPICGQNLSKRAQQDTHYLHCTTCMWSTKDAGLELEKKEWKQPEHPAREHLTKVCAYWKSLMPAQGRTDLELTRRSASTLGVIKNDKYGLNKSLALRRPHLGLPTTKEPFKTNEAVEEVPELDPSIFTTPPDPLSVPTLDQTIRLPLADPKNLVPVPKRLVCRRSARCPDHDLLIYRGEYDISNVAAKNYYACNHFCPELRFSKEVDFVPDEEFSMFLTITNMSTSTMEMLVETFINTEDSNCLQVVEPEPLELKLRARDGTLTDTQLGDRYGREANLSLDAEHIGKIVSQSDNCAKIHFRCRAHSTAEPKRAYLLLQVKYHKEGEKDQEQRVKMFARQLEDYGEKAKKMRAGPMRFLTPTRPAAAPLDDPLTATKSSSSASFQLDEPAATSTPARDPQPKGKIEKPVAWTVD